MVLVEDDALGDQQTTRSTSISVILEEQGLMGM